MKMFLVGMCDIFLILYLTTLSQVNPFHNSFLTVDDYNKLKEANVKAEKDSEESDAQILELKNKNSELDKQKDQAIQSTLSAEAEIKKATHPTKLIMVIHQEMLRLCRHPDQQVLSQPAQ